MTTICSIFIFQRAIIVETLRILQQKYATCNMNVFSEPRKNENTHEWRPTQLAVSCDPRKDQDQAEPHQFWKPRRILVQDKHRQLTLQTSCHRHQKHGQWGPKIHVKIYLKKCTLRITSTFGYEKHGPHPFHSDPGSSCNKNPRHWAPYCPASSSSWKNRH